MCGDPSVMLLSDDDAQVFDRDIAQLWDLAAI